MSLLVLVSTHYHGMQPPYHSSQLINKFKDLMRLHILPYQKSGIIYLPCFHSQSSSFIHNLHIFLKCRWSTLHTKPLPYWNGTGREWNLHEHWTPKSKILDNSIPILPTVHQCSAVRRGELIMCPVWWYLHSSVFTVVQSANTANASWKASRAPKDPYSTWSYFLHAQHFQHLPWQLLWLWLPSSTRLRSAKQKTKQNNSDL